MVITTELRPELCLGVRVRFVDKEMAPPPVPSLSSCSKRTVFLAVVQIIEGDDGRFVAMTGGEGGGDSLIALDCATSILRATSHDAVDVDVGVPVDVWVWGHVERNDGIVGMFDSTGKRK